MKPPAHPAAFALAYLLAFALSPAAGCGRAPERAATRVAGSELPVTVLADSAEVAGLPPARLFAGLPEAKLILVRVAPARSGVQAALPEPEPSAPALPEGSGEGLAADDALRPPVPRGATTLRVRDGRRAWLELDVRVDENGEVSDALPVAGDTDSATTRGAIDAALGLRWYPATRRGRPVAVWCRQRFELAPRP
jgi:hypothetical protein